MTRPSGIVLLSAFFAFGALMASIAALTLVDTNQSPLEFAWRVNPSGHDALLSFGRWGVALMILVAAACGATSVGLWRLRPWGRVLALALLATNLVGDIINAARGEVRTLIGVPIALAMILYLVRSPIRNDR